MLIILRYVLILIVILSVACKDSLITTEEVPAGRRDYVWEVDSIGNNYKNVFHTIWGTDDNNLWIGGGTATFGNYSENVLHFDGKSWNNNHNVRMDPCYEIKGDVDKVFFCAENKVICLENGELTEMPLDLSPLLLLDSLYTGLRGITKINSELYACGFSLRNGVNISAVFWKLNNNKWDCLNIFDGNDGSSWQYLDIGQNKKIIFMNMYKTNEDGYRIASYNGKEIDILTGEGTKIMLVETVSDCLFSQGDEIFDYNRKDFVKVATLGIGHKPKSRIFGRNKNDLFFFDEGKLYHFNGTDSKVLFHFGKDVGINDCLILNDSIFFLVSSNNDLINYIIKGKFEN